MVHTGKEQDKPDSFIYLNAKPATSPLLPADNFIYAPGFIYII